MSSYVGSSGFMLTDLYLLPLLSGQETDLPNGKLALAPKYPAPYGPSESTPSELVQLGAFLPLFRFSDCLGLCCGWCWQCR